MRRKKFIEPCYRDMKRHDHGILLWDKLGVSKSTKEKKDFARNRIHELENGEYDTDEGRVYDR